MFVFFNWMWSTACFIPSSHAPKNKKEVKQKIQTSILGGLQQEEYVKSRNHSVLFESDSIKQQCGVPNHRQQTIKFK